MLRLHARLSGGEAQLDSRILRKRLGYNYKALMEAGGFVKVKNYCTLKCRATTYGLVKNLQHNDQGESWMMRSIEELDEKEQREWVDWEFGQWDDVTSFMPAYREFREKYLGKTGRIKIVKNRMYSKIQNIDKRLRPKGLMEMDQTATFACSLTRYTNGEERKRLVGVLEEGSLYEKLAERTGLTRQDAKITFNTALNRLTSWYSGNPVMIAFREMFPRATYRYTQALRKAGSRGDDGLFNTVLARDEGFVWLQALKELERKKIGCVTIHDCVLFEPKDRDVVESTVNQAARRQWGFQPHMKFKTI